MSDTAPAATGSEAPAEVTETGSETPTIESLQAEIEALKGHSRKWEDRAKENYEAKKELDGIRREQMSDDERRQAEAADRAEALRLAEERAEKAEREALRFRIASSHGVSDEDADLFLTGSDEETLTRQAEALAGRSTGPRPNPAQGRQTKTPAATPADAFADAMSELF